MREKNDKKKFVFDRWEFIKKIVENKEVLDFGCAELVGTTNNPEKKERWLHGKIKKIAKKLVGVEISEEQSEALRKKGFEIITGNAEIVEINDKFDVIMAGELIEHLSNPGIFLDRVKNFLREEGKLILTTPNRFNFLLFCKSFWNNSIPTYEKEIAKHVFYFDENSLKDLLIRHEYYIEDVAYYQSFGKNYDKFLDSFWIKLIAKFRPAFLRGLIVVAKKKHEKNI